MMLLLARAMQMFMPGKLQILYLDLFAFEIEADLPDGVFCLKQ